jgi:D-alanyl-D-alanine carboxypeptidase/D-alanyl-D-alanine-endopeptidase (penicillin-binding protein 4)
MERPLVETGRALSRVLALSFVLLLLCPGAWAASGVGKTAWAKRLDAALGVGAFESARIGALIVRRGDGRTVYARSPDEMLIPASNMKVLTALTVLDHYGPAHRFETVIRSDRPPDARGAVGELAIVGGGDPVLNSEDWWRLAADLRAEGLRAVEGDLWVDDSLFDREYWHPDWGSISFRAYHAPVAALSANYGAFFIEVAPAKAEGRPLEVDVDPPIPYLEVANQGRTVGRKGRRGLVLERGAVEKGREIIELRGRMRVGDEPQRFARGIRNPVLYAGEILKWQLQALGIVVKGRVRHGPARQPNVLLRYRGRPLSEIVRLFMKYSNNAVAETLVKGLGTGGGARKGTWATGLEAMNGRLGSMGVLASGTAIVDASGLSPANRLSARVLVNAMERAERAFALGPEFMSAFPIAGRDGTLEERASGSAEQIRAKTGLLKNQGVLSLSGMARRGDGQEFFFSVLVNGFGGNPKAAMDALDRWLEVLIATP